MLITTKPSEILRRSLRSNQDCLPSRALGFQGSSDLEMARPSNIQITFQTCLSDHCKDPKHELVMNGSLPVETAYAVIEGKPDK